MARLGMARLGSHAMVRCGQAWRGKAGKSCRGGVWFGGACSVRASLGAAVEARRGALRLGAARQSSNGGAR